MKRKEIDILIASSPANVFYTSGLPVRHAENNPILFALSNRFPSFVVIRQDGEAGLVVWLGFDRTLTWVRNARGISSREDAVKNVISMIKDAGLAKAKIGVESTIPLYLYQELAKEFPKAEFATADDIFSELRIVKSPEEIERIKESTRIAEKSIVACIETLKEGTTDVELLKKAKTTIIQEGGFGTDHTTISIGGSDPEAPGTGVKMKRGDIARLDVGAIYKGYCSDVSRHAVLKEMPPNAEKLHALTMDVQQVCVDAIKAGVTTSELNRTVYEACNRLGRKVMIIPIAHSIGIETEELHFIQYPGSILKPPETVFKPNMVLDVEVWTPFPPFRGLGIEDTYVVTESGCERISTLDRKIYIIE